LEYEKLNNLYISCMNCQMDCKNVMKNIPEGIPPRGFYFNSIPVKILIVAKNPGHPLENEMELFKGNIGKKLFDIYRNYQKKLYGNISLNKEKSTTFHKNLFRYISFILDIPNTIDDIYKNVAHTNLLKCSTYDERQKLTENDIRPCYNKYFMDEIKYLNPKVLLALGREAYKFLYKRKDQHGLPVVYIKHPSYYYKRGVEMEKLTEIKNEVNNLLKK